MNAGSATFWTSIYGRQWFWARSFQFKRPLEKCQTDVWGSSARGIGRCILIWIWTSVTSSNTLLYVVFALYCIWQYALEHPAKCGSTRKRPGSSWMTTWLAVGEGDCQVVSHVGGKPLSLNFANMVEGSCSDCGTLKRVEYLHLDVGLGFQAGHCRAAAFARFGIIVERWR